MATPSSNRYLNGYNEGGASGSGVVYKIDDLGETFTANVAITAGATKYAPIDGVTATPASADSTGAIELMFNRPGIIKDLTVTVDAAPTSTYSITGTVRTGTVPVTMADSILTAVVTGAATTASDTTDEVYVAAGSFGSLKIISSNASAVSAFAIVSFKFVPVAKG
jgi:hypothetical protein